MYTEKNLNRNTPSPKLQRVDPRNTYIADLLQGVWGFSSRGKIIVVYPPFDWMVFETPKTYLL